ncbi:gamma-glutamyl-gamma-aminobutyrate hydrolase family protein [Magnetovibrio blakemorei]|uniref:Uncharacterized protein n=1 Tax=Magnetovibrio blakemorei TaxID=28181 RepID=A0A1E5QBX0_9PROT|nr:gamma-glutamyl-gamma-aminobutyrate hydrolase family protein [Magnetovibrio blakemorei]OEJ69565.1 hypothetical protein BEN30_02490 [Magnetovibrio blakemorei]
MIIFVSMRSSPSPTYHEKRDAISHDWCRLFDAFGLRPVLVSNAMDDPVGFLDVLPGRGLLLTGGDDIGTVNRDRTEGLLLEAALTRQLPVFGVCRGLQMINQYFGGTLTRNLGGGHLAQQHEIEIVDDLNGVLPVGAVTVNSFHNDGVTTNGLAEELCAFALSDNSIVEGLYHPLHPITAIQWHPERDNLGRAMDKILLQRWLKQCA